MKQLQKDRLTFHFLITPNDPLYTEKPFVFGEITI
jgi:hypothetical protein